ncbi:unnamed protein product, partial [Prorocentrum cordatum]
QSQLKGRSGLPPGRHGAAHAWLGQGGAAPRGAYRATGSHGAGRREAAPRGPWPEDTPWEAEALYAHLKGSYWSEEAPPPRGAGPAAGWAPWPLAAAAVLPAVGLWWAASRAPAWARGRCEDGAEMRAVLRTGALPCGLASGSSATSLLSESPAAAAG